MFLSDPNLYGVTQPVGSFPGPFQNPVYNPIHNIPRLLPQTPLTTPFAAFNPLTPYGPLPINPMATAFLPPVRPFPAFTPFASLAPFAQLPVHPFQAFNPPWMSLPPQPWVDPFMAYQRPFGF